MANPNEISLPDIGDFDAVDVIDVLVKVGDTVNVEDALITLESDKATIDIPSPAAGVVTEIKVHVGDKVSEGAPILLIDETETSHSATAEKIVDKTSADETPAEPVNETSDSQTPAEPANASESVSHSRNQTHVAERSNNKASRRLRLADLDLHRNPTE